MYHCRHVYVCTQCMNDICMFMYECMYVYICNMYCIYVSFQGIFVFSMCMAHIWMYVCNMHIICMHISNVCVSIHISNVCVCVYICNL